MIFYKGTIGSNNFCWDNKEFPGWEHKNSDRVARREKYRDGTHVFHCHDNPYRFVNDCCGITPNDCYPD